MVDKKELDYFRMPNPVWFILVIPMMFYLAFLAYMPELIFFESLGPFGALSKYLYVNHKILTILIFWSAWGAHFLEAIYVVKTGKLLNINSKCLNKWFFQTLFVGYPSTALMRSFKRKQMKESKSK